jgi:sulfofructose kinase
VAGVPVPRFDIIGFGAVAVDDLVFLDGFPLPDTKVRVVRRERHAGGLTGTALVAAARLGASCAYAGTLGPDDLSRFIMDGLAAEGVSVDLVRRVDRAGPFHSTILIDTREKTRTILSDPGAVVLLDPAHLPAAAIRAAGVVFVDHEGIEGMAEVARIARESGVAVVADLEKRREQGFDRLLGLVDHPIVPWELAAELTGAVDGPAAVRRMWELPVHPNTGGRAAVVVTRGVDGSWCTGAEHPGKVFHQPAFRVRTVDTTGCGDVFHGAYAAALRRGRPLVERVRFAAAVAALKATRVGGQKGIPSLAEAERFLAERPGEAEGEWA